MDKKMIGLLACPVYQGILKWAAESEEFICSYDGLAFPVTEGIPVMLPERARELSADEKLG
jgi:uncharacterized protein YbaR (Trm112 family)